MEYKFQNKFQNLQAYLPSYGFDNFNINLKLIAGMFLAVIALSMFATLVAADDAGASITGDVRAGIRADIAAHRAEVGANASVTWDEVEAASRRGAAGLPSRRMLDANRAIARYGMFRSRLAHYINEQCEEMRGTDRIHCFERILAGPLPANLTSEQGGGGEGSELREANEAAGANEVSAMHARRFQVFHELAEAKEHKLAAGACLGALSTTELAAAFADVKDKVESKLVKFAAEHSSQIATMPADAKVEVQTSANGSIVLPKVVLARAVLSEVGKDSPLAQKCLTEAKSAKEHAEEKFNHSRDEFKDKLREFREIRHNATAEEKNVRLGAAISALIEARINAAQKFEAHGASNISVSAFVASMEAKKAQVANSTFEQRKALLHEINEEWHAFVRSTVSGVVTAKIETATLRLKAAVSQAETTIAQLKSSGKDVSQLESLAVEANAAITATQETNLTMHEAMHRLVTARSKVMHLVRAVNAVLNNRPVPAVEAQTAEPEAPENVMVNTAANAEAEENDA